MTRPVIAHLTTVDLSLRYLLMPQLLRPLELGIESVGISAPGEWVPELEAAGIRHISITSSTRGMSLVSDMRAAIELWRVLRRLRPQVLHTHNPKPGIYGRIVGRLAGVPVVVNTVHGLYAMPEDRWLRRAVVYTLEWLAARFSDAELVQSIEDFRLMRRLRIAPAVRLRHLGNGIDLRRFDPDELTAIRPQVRRELGAGPDRIVVGMVGRLVAEKGYLELFEAARNLPEGYLVVCVGPADPSKADALTAADIAAAEAAGVMFLGMRTDIERLYAGMDLFVLPSHREGFPRSAMEAVAMGLPVIATDIRGCREVVDHDVTGRLVPLCDPAALASAIREMGGDPGKRAAMGAAGRAKSEQFDERRVLSRVMATYAAVARRKRLTQLVSALAGAHSEVKYRPAVVADAGFCASLHTEAISTGFLPTLGTRFMQLLYRALIEDGVVLVAEDEGGPVGMVAGCVDTGRLYRRFARRYGLAAGLAALPRAIRPSVVGKIWQTVRYGAGGGTEAAAELLSMAVVVERRGEGIGHELQQRFLAEMERAGVDGVRVVVGAANQTAIVAYLKTGFEPVGPIEVHSGDPSEVLIWRARER